MSARRLEWTGTWAQGWDTAGVWRLEGIPGAVAKPASGDTVIFNSSVSSDSPGAKPAVALVLAEVIFKGAASYSLWGFDNISSVTTTLTLYDSNKPILSGTWGVCNVLAGGGTGDGTNASFTVVNMNHASAGINGNPAIALLNIDAGCTQGGTIATANFRGASKMQGGTVTGLLRWASSGIFTSESAAIVLSGCRIEVYRDLSIEKSNLAVTGDASTRVVVMRREVVVKLINVANGTYFPVSVREAYGFGPRGIRP